MGPPAVVSGVPGEFVAGEAALWTEDGALGAFDPATDDPEACADMEEAPLVVALPEGPGTETWTGTVPPAEAPAAGPPEVGEATAPAAEPPFGA